MDINWSQIFTGILPLLGVVVGGFATYFTQNATIKRQLNREREKEIHQMKIELLDVYNKVLKTDGENQMIDSGEFTIDVYTQKMRPILYSKFHLLHVEIAGRVRIIDSIIEKEEGYVGIEQSSHEDLMKHYAGLLESIDSRIQYYRRYTFKGVHL